MKKYKKLYNPNCYFIKNKKTSHKTLLLKRKTIENTTKIMYNNKRICRKNEILQNITKCNKKIILFHKFPRNVFSVRKDYFKVPKRTNDSLIYTKESIYNIFEVLGETKRPVIRRIL